MILPHLTIWCWFWLPWSLTPQIRRLWHRWDVFDLGGRTLDRNSWLFQLFLCQIEVNTSGPAPTFAISRRFSFNLDTNFSTYTLERSTLLSTVCSQFHELNMLPSKPYHGLFTCVCCSEQLSEITTYCIFVESNQIVFFWRHNMYI